jgi:hypothetical protein
MWVGGKWDDLNRMDKGWRIDGQCTESWFW